MSRPPRDLRPAPPPLTAGHAVEPVGCAHHTVLLHADAARAWWACRDCGERFAPAAPGRALVEPSGVDGDEVTEYVSIRDLCRRIPYREGTIRNLMSQGQLHLGVHYLKPHHGRIVFVWSAMRAWLAGRGPATE
jgi:hypothetical protein